MRTVFLGTPEFAVPSLRALLSTPNQFYDVRAVITQPDRPAGRGQRLSAPPVKLVAQEAGIPVLQPERLRRSPEVFELLQEIKPEIIVIVAFGQLLPADFFSYPPFGTVNVHASLLPKYRGAGPVAHAVLNGETETGTTIMKIDEGMDTGDVLSQRKIPVGPDATAGELERILAVQGAELLVETLPLYVSGKLKPVPQDSSQASYAPRLKKEDALITWTRTAQAVHNAIRAYNPWPVAFSRLREQEVKIWRSCISCRDASGSNPVQIPSGQPGEVVAIDREGIVVACGENSFLTLIELQLPGRNRNRAADIANGLKLRPGERFGAN